MVIPMERLSCSFWDTPLYLRRSLSWGIAYMRILFLTLYPDVAASPRYRVTQFLPYLRDQGVECVVASAVTASQHARLTGPNRVVHAGWYHLVETPRRIAQLLGAGRFDIVFVQKAIMTAYVKGMDRLLRRIAGRVVLDIDDAVHLKSPHSLSPRFAWLQDSEQLDKVMAQADLVLAGNEWLSKAAQAAGARTEVFPTVVDTDRFVPASSPPDEFTIGWIGNPSTTPYLQEAADGLNQVKDARVCVVGADCNGLPSSNWEARTWSLESEVADIQRFSVGVMPLPKTDWARGKCALKALLYMACGVPCVGTPHGAIEDIIEHGRNGFFADSPDEWREAIERLKDPDGRAAVGRAGRETVEENYSLTKAAPRLLKLLESIL